MLPFRNGGYALFGRNTLCGCSLGSFGYQHAQAWAGS
jgi:hypothetical protein